MNKKISCQSCGCEFDSIVKMFQCVYKHSICEHRINAIYHNTKMKPLIKMRSEHCKSCLTYWYLKQFIDTGKK